MICDDMIIQGSSPYSIQFNSVSFHTIWLLFLWFGFLSFPLTRTIIHQCAIFMHIYTFKINKTLYQRWLHSRLRPHTRIGFLRGSRGTEYHLASSVMHLHCLPFPTSKCAVWCTWYCCEGEQPNKSQSTINLALYCTVWDGVHMVSQIENVQESSFNGR